MADKKDLKFYLTNLEPMMSQNSLSQSIGGHCSTTEINPAKILSNSINRIQTNISIENLDNDYILQNTDELLKITSIIDTSNAEVERGVFNTDAKFALSDDLFYSVKKNNLLNNSFNSSGKQYRCIAVKNNGLDTFYNLKFYYFQQLIPYHIYHLYLNNPFYIQELKNGKRYNHLILRVQGIE